MRISPENQAILDSIRSMEPAVYLNQSRVSSRQALEDSIVTQAEVHDAAERLKRFAPFIARVFPQTAGTNGIIESQLRELPKMPESLADAGTRLPGRLFLKMDNDLPVSGSIKARGGFYEVMALAEKLALEQGLITKDSNYSILASDEAKKLFAQYSIVVGSTGNLGLSVGLMGAAFGFKVTVHMSADARQWKKAKLRENGVTVVEHAGDYGQAVQAGRLSTQSDPKSHFVDDESSRELFLGYAVGGLRMKKQLEEAGIAISEKAPLIVHIPCGVGGGPAGVSFGLKLCFGDAVHCFFAEPLQAPCFISALASGQNENISVQDLGLSGVTAADGLAVGRASALACRVMKDLISGCYTLPDDFLFTELHRLYETEKIRLEPSAIAGFYGIGLAAQGLLGEAASSPGAIHLVWGTGGSLVPLDEWEQYNKRGTV